jgi:hypothetical protein
MQVTTQFQLWTDDLLQDVTLTAEVEFDKSYPMTIEVRNIRATWEGVDYTNDVYDKSNHYWVEDALKEAFKEESRLQYV